MSSGIGTPVAADARLDEAIDLMRGTRVAAHEVDRLIEPRVGCDRCSDAR